MRTLVGVLTSFDIMRAKRAVYSAAYHQKGYINNYEVVLFVNSRDATYATEVRKAINDVEIVETRSDGRPGRGKQSVINYFMAHEEYGSLILIDGDDFFYPTAFMTIEQIIEKTNTDVLGLASHDLLLDYDHEFSYIALDERRDLVGWFGNQVNHLSKHSYERGKPVGEQRTPDRLIYFNRIAFECAIRPWFPTELNVYEDYVCSLTCLAAYLMRMFNYTITSTSVIYVCDGTSRKSTCNNFIESGGKWSDVNEVFAKALLPYDKIIENYGMSHIPWYHNPNENCLSTEQKVQYIKMMLRDF